MSVYGAQGYGWYWILIEMMRDEKDYCLDIEGKYSFYVIAKELCITQKKAEAFIKDCINEFKLFKTDGKTVWSQSLRERMAKIDSRREKAKQAINGRWGKTEKEDENEIPKLYERNTDVSINQYENDTDVQVSKYERNTDVSINQYENDTDVQVSKYERNTIKEKKRKEKKSKVKEEIKDKENPSVCSEILNHFNEKFKKHYQLTEDINEKIRIRLKTYSKEQLIKAIDIVSMIPFYTGLNDRGWKATPKWLFASDGKVNEILNKEDEIDVKKLMYAQANKCFSDNEETCEVEISKDMEEKCKVCFRERNKWKA
jgi:hypothetical protein